MHIVLLLARGGTLDPAWRDNPDAVFGGSDAEFAALDVQYPGLGDARQLALREMVDTPLGAWEPHQAGGDWRRALEAWRQAALAAREDYERESQMHWNSMREDLGAAATRLRTFQRHSLIDPADARMARDLIDVSYRAALAAGGDPVDWRAWVAPRTAGWPDAVQPTLTEKLWQALDQPIPDYWSQPCMP